MRAVIYARVSSKEQEESGYSLPAQEKLLKEYAEKKGFEVAEVFSVSESAYGKVQRKVFHQMLAFMKRHRIPILIVETTDRLTRNFKEVMNIDKWLEENEEHQVHLVREGTILHKNARSHEWFVWRMKVATAEFYVRQLSENVKKGQEEKIREGWLPTKPPLGYKTVGEKGHKIHVLDEKVAPLVRKMFELYSSGNYSLKKMVEMMYKEGLRTRSGNKLVKSRLASLLSNPFYYGAVEWNGKIYPGKHEPLIPKELFDRVQIILKRKGVPKYRKHFPLFKGLIRCDECGGLITWETHKGHWYGACNHYRKCSQKGYVRQEKVEEQIIPYFEKLTIKNERLANWIKKALKESHRDEIEYHRSCINELRERYERIQKRLSLLYDDKLDGKITSDFYEEKLREYTKEKEEIINSIERHSNAQNKYFALGVNILELSQRAKEIYLMASEEQKRMLLNLVFSKITLNNGKIKVVYSKPFEICLRSIEFTNKIFEPEFSKQGEPKAPKISILLRGWNDFRTLKWVEEIECPELVINQVKELLQGYRFSLQ